MQALFLGELVGETLPAYPTCDVKVVLINVFMMMNNKDPTK